MSAWPGRLQPSTDLGVATGLAVTRGVVVPRRVLIALALAALALGVVLSGVMLDRDLGGTSRAAPSAVHAHSYSRAGLLSLPLAAQGPVSAVLGANSRAYRVTPTREGLRAASPAQQLKLSFTRTGLSIASGQARLALGLRAVGYGASLRSLGAVMPRLEGDRVAYSHPAASAWYANGPLGLEQGFTVPRAPAGHAAGALTLAIALRGNLHALLTDHGRAVTLSRAGHPVLRYSDLLATDANGHTLRSWLVLDAGRLLIRVAARGASYPLRVDPLVQNTKLTGGEESGDARFGASVALSSDGNTALVGGGLDNEAAGAAWVFTNSGGTWTQQGPKLVGDCTSSCGGPSGTEESGEGEFGTSVALSSDGNTALVGGGTDDSGIGSAWVFTRSLSTWSQQGSKLTPNDAENLGNGDDFGSSVALSADGETALIGAPRDGESLSPSHVGAAWVFTGSGSHWTQQGPKLTNSPSSVSEFGRSVALSSEGTIALIGGEQEEDTHGAAWVFTPSGSTWTQQGSKLTPNDASGAASAFGDSVALSGNGDTALIGGFYDNLQAGAAWIFDAPGTGGGEASGGTGTDTGTAGSSGGGGTSTGTGTSAGTGSSTGAGNASTGKGSSGSAAASLAKQLGLPSSKGCVSQRKLAIHVAEHIAQAGGSAKIKSAEVLLNGHVVAKLKGSDLIAHVSLAGLAKGSFKVTVKATTTAGKTLSASSTFHTCAHAKGHK